MSSNADDKELEALGYAPSFKREFSNLATVNIMSYSTHNRLTSLVDKLCFQYHVGRQIEVYAIQLT